MIVNFKNSSEELIANSRKIRWSGTLRYPGYRVGGESARAFLEDNTAFGDRVSKLRGTFALEYCENSASYIAVDNRADYTVFFHGNKIFTSLLSLLDESHFTVSQLDLNAVLELMFYGNIYSQRSPVKGVQRLSGSEYLFWSDGKLTVKKKAHLIDPITLTDENLNLYDEVNKVFSDMPDRISLDLTGGGDTRLTIAFLMSCGKEFEVATTGGDDFPDVIIAKRIAAILKKKIHQYVQKLEDVESDLNILLELSDGLSNPLLFQRRFRMNALRRQRGIEHALSSFGPPKDAYWSFLWPFIGRQNLNVDQYYWIKLKPHLNNHIFENTAFQPVLSGYRRYIIEIISRFERQPAFLYADAIGYHFNEKLHNIKENIDQIDTTYLYIEPEVIQAIKNFPTQRQYNHRFFSDYTTPVCPEVSAIRTDKGLNLLSGFPHNFSNELISRMEILKKIDRRIRYKLTGKSVKQTADHPALYNRLKKTTTFREAVHLLQKYNLIAGTVETIPNGMAGPVLSLCEIVKRLHQ